MLTNPSKKHVRNSIFEVQNSIPNPMFFSKKTPQDLKILDQKSTSSKLHFCNKKNTLKDPVLQDAPWPSSGSPPWGKWVPQKQEAFNRGKLWGEVRGVFVATRTWKENMSTFGSFDLWSYGTFLEKSWSNKKSKILHAQWLILKKDFKKKKLLKSLEGCEEGFWSNFHIGKEMWCKF